jgi:type IX secretion system PorP/SprF family membrane protein
MRYISTLFVLALLPAFGFAQSDQHYTMFMYNKLLYNPGYAGSRDATSINALYRNQWTGLAGAPKTMNISVDGLVGSYMQPFRKVAVGLNVNSEKLGVESNTNIRGYYAYRIKLERSVVSMGLNAGGGFYSANYSALNPIDPNDKNLTQDVKNAFLPNVGAGVYWSGKQFYAGLSVPNLVENYYDKRTKGAKQIRAFYLSGGYTYALNEIIQLVPQAMVRYAGLGTDKLPLNADINLSAVAYNRFMLGFTYRTNKSFDAIMHMQVTRNINIGYAYDYMLSGLNAYSGGTHELVLGYDFVKTAGEVASPRFIKAF